MTENEKTGKITLDGTEYDIDNLSEAAKAQVANIQFADARLQQLNNELAVQTQPASVIRTHSNQSWQKLKTASNVK